MLGKFLTNLSDVVIRSRSGNLRQPALFRNEVVLTKLVFEVVRVHVRLHSWIGRFNMLKFVSEGPQ